MQSRCLVFITNGRELDRFVLLKVLMGSISPILDCKCRTTAIISSPDFLLGESGSALVEDPTEIAPEINRNVGTLTTHQRYIGGQAQSRKRSAMNG